MGDDFKSDAYRGLRSEWKKLPWTVTTLGLVLMALGMFATFIYPNLAQGEDVSSLKKNIDNVDKKVDTLTASLIEREIQATQALYCKSSNKDYFRTRIAELSRKYVELAKSAPSIPTCEDLK